MFPADFFGPRYFNGHYWPKVGADIQHIPGSECWTVTVPEDSWAITVPEDSWRIPVPECED